MEDLATEQPFGGLSREMNRMIDQLNRGYFGFAPGETWKPAVNLYESDQAYLVCVDLAGVEKDKIDIQLIDGHLLIRGARPVPSFEAPTEARQAEAGARLRVHLMEIDHGSFSRQVEIPKDVHHHDIQATYRNGMLWIELPKK